MKGVIFNLLERFIVEGWGTEIYERVLGQCPLQTKEPFVGPGTYPDSDLMAIVEKTCETLQVPVADAVRAFGKFCFPHLVAGHLHFLDGYDHPRDLLKTVDSVIHVEVRKLYPQAVTPEFSHEELPGGALLLRYRSPRQLCALVEGLIDGVAEHYRMPIDCRHVTCTRDGAAACEFMLGFAALPVGAR
ncbi:MAG: heme NO-binding domain-containing protein [Candidatus Eisenbacteria bacterium]|nr:heme NO-binding domain-containing protein [Candidatus Eisenbacteria bacterium]MCC7143223.1 heme NO-binding domain-containing protein [Candidatus Eisenbacteria bacterium]